MGLSNTSMDKIEEFEGYDSVYRNLAYANYHMFIDAELSEEEALTQTHKAIIKKCTEVLENEGTSRVV